MKEFTYKLVENEGELKGAFEVRRQVFMKEQGISEDLVFDGSDGEAMQLIVNRGKRVIGTARVRFLEAKQAKLERMAVLKTFRHTGIGKRIVSFLTEELKGKQIEKIVLHAQYDAIGFYQACGFKIQGPPFQEAGIKHLEMEMKF